MIRFKAFVTQLGAKGENASLAKGAIIEMSDGGGSAVNWDGLMVVLQGAQVRQREGRTIETLVDTRI
jgi:hypothetical protein